MALAVTRSNGIRVSSGGAADEIAVDHDGANATVTNSVGTLTVKNTQTDEDIILNVNDGGVDTEVLRLRAADSTIFHGAVDAYNLAIGALLETKNTAANNVFNTYVMGSSANRTAFNLGKSGGTESFPTSVSSGSTINIINSNAYDGGAYRPVAQSAAYVDTFTGVDDVSGYFVVATRNDGAAATIIERFRIGKQGNLTALAPYTTVIGGTNIDLYIDNTGLIGPAPSSGRYKENVTAIDPSDTEWVLNVPVKTFNFIGSATEQIGVIAEELEVVNPAAVRYDTYQVGEADALTKIDRGRYRFVKDESEILKNAIVTENVKKTEIIDEEEVETIIEMNVKRIAEGIHKDQVIYALVNEVQKLIARVAVLEGLAK